MRCGNGAGDGLPFNFLHRIDAGMPRITAPFFASGVDDLLNHRQLDKGADGVVNHYHIGLGAAWSRQRATVSCRESPPATSRTGLAKFCRANLLRGSIHLLRPQSKKISSMASDAGEFLRV